MRSPRHVHSPFSMTASRFAMYDRNSPSASVDVILTFKAGRKRTVLISSYLKCLTAVSND